jgi:hypothetical protein
MRDPNRIPTVLRELERIWSRHPDWRLGQLISNIASWADEDVWDIEEDEMISEIDRHVRQWDERTSDATGIRPSLLLQSPPTDWLPGFFERTAGAWQGPLVREDQGEYEIREPLE